MADDDAGELEAALRRDARVAGRSWGGYALRRALQHGAAAVVFEAEHRATGRVVALKVLRPQVARDRNELARFVQESALLAEIEHPNVVGVVDAGQVGHLHVQALEWVAGRDLAALVATHGRAPLAWACRAVAAAASATARLHALGVLHRDLKPHNVLVEEGTGRPVLLDLGIAKDLTAGAGAAARAEGRSPSGRAPAQVGALRAVVGAPHTAKRQILGTPAYMAPEQADPGGRDPVGERTDVYGLGTILFHLLTGLAPFEGEDVVALLDAVQHEPPLRVRDVRGGAPAPLDHLVARCLAKRPADRPASAAELARDLRRLARALPAEGEGPHGPTWAPASDDPAADGPPLALAAEEAEADEHPAAPPPARPTADGPGEGRISARLRRLLFGERRPPAQSP